MDKAFKVVITDFIADSLTIETTILDGQAQVIALDAFSEEDLHGKIEDADALIMYHTITLTSKTIDRLQRCKLIVRAGVGIDNVDHQHARSRGIPVANIPDYGSEEVADSAIGMMLALTRGISFLNSRLRGNEGAWSYAQVQPLTRLRNATIGIVGLGRIGTATTLRAKAIGMDVVFYDPFKPDGFDKALGIRRAETFEMLIQEVKILSLHCPLTPQTFHLINKGTIEKFQAGAFLINTARGGIVDTSAIPDAIESGRLRGAAFDVLELEPPVGDLLVQAWKDPQHPAYHRVIINPHSAFYSEEGLKEIRVKGAQACMRALLGGEVRNIVN